MKLKDGIYLNLSNEVYHEQLERDLISASFLKTFKKSPRLAWLQKTKEAFKIKKTPSMEFGNLVHELILEPEILWNKEFLQEGETKRKAENKDKIGYDDHQELLVINEIWNLQEHNYQKQVIDNSVKEITIISNGKKARLDYLCFGKNFTILGDVKTHKVEDVHDTNGLSMKMNYNILDQNYLLQLQFYKMMFLEVIQRIKKGEDLTNELQYNIDEINLNINCEILAICNKAPFSILKIDVPEYYLNENEINTLIASVKEQKEKHNGLEKIWDDNRPRSLQYQGFLGGGDKIPYEDENFNN